MSSMNSWWMTKSKINFEAALQAPSELGIESTINLDFWLKTFEVSKDASSLKANSCSKLGGTLFVTINPWGSSHEMLGITRAPGSMFSTINPSGVCCIK